MLICRDGKVYDVLDELKIYCGSIENNEKQRQRKLPHSEIVRGFVAHYRNYVYVENAKIIEL